MKNTISKILVAIYGVSLVVFLLAGIVLVVSQLIGSMLGLGSLVLAAYYKLGSIAILADAICGLSAFINSYFSGTDSKKS